jgi:signal transduction histidine kinase
VKLRRPLVTGAGGWVALVALCLLGGSSPAPQASIVVVMVLVAFWHGWELGRAAGLAAAAACVVLGELAMPQLGGAGTLGLVAGVVVAALGGEFLRRRHRQACRRLEAAERELASLREALGEARNQTAKLRGQLGQAERFAAVGTMSAQLAHQLRNPLTSMQLYVQLLEDELHGGGDSGPAEALDLLQLVLHELKVLVEITDNYLQYARLPELAPAALDVNRAVGELVRFLRPEASRKGIALSTQFAEGLPPVEADRRLVRFALMNLLKNGVEAMAQGGRLRVKTAQQNGAVEIHVSDTGPGIETSEAEHIFEPFYTTKDSGSGLGLSLSRQIIEKHNGSLTCESMVGVGTTFVVKLPVEA